MNSRKIFRTFCSMEGQKVLRSDRKNHGFSLTEVMVALAISGVLTLGFTLFSDNVNKSTKMLNNRIARDATAARLSHMLSQPAAIANSITSTVIGSYGENAALRNCVFQDSANPCTVTSPANQAPFTLVVGDVPMAGGTDPIRYDFRGKRACGVSASSTCQLAARTTFWATCGDPTATSCTGARTLHFRYQIKQEYMFTGASDSISPTKDNMAPIPPEPAFSNNKADFSLTLSADEIRNVTSNNTQLCFDAVAFMTGRTAEGNVICKCPPGYSETADGTVAGGVRCTGQDKACPKDEFPVSYNPSTRTFNCAKRDDIQCNSNALDCSTGGCSCAAGQFIREFKAGTCSEVTIPGGGKKGPTATKEIQCTGSTARCCWYEHF